jgi:hypothetical protein
VPFDALRRRGCRAPAMVVPHLHDVVGALTDSRCGR